MTASIFSEDQTACVMAGMNGILGKPVGQRELLDAIAQHVWPHRSDHLSIAASDMSGEPIVSAVLSAARLNQLRATLPADTLANLVEECLYDLSERLALLLEAVRQQASDQIVAHAHAMAGMAAEYGCLRWRPGCALMRAMGRTPNSADASGRRAGGRPVPRRRRHARDLSHRNGLSVQAMSIFWSDHACMLSPATLSAFSTGIAQSGFGQTGPVHRVRGVGTQLPQSASPAAPAILAPSARDGDATPGRPLPRGSLLDLSV
jgi:hypothetical protein